MPHGGPHLPGGEALTTDDEGDVTGSPEEEFQVTDQDGQGPSPIGVPSTVRGPGGQPVPFQAIREGRVPAPFDPRLQGRTDVLPGGAGTVRGQVSVPPQYYDGHEKQPALFNIRSTEDKLRTQLALEEAGLLDEYSPGQWDESTWKAFRDVLEHANVNGLDWQTSLNQLVANPVVDKDADGDGGQKLPPDYATLAQDIKGWMRQNLGRDPRDHELTTLAQQTEQLYRADYDQERQAQEYQAQVEAGIEQEEGQAALGRDINAKARFNELLEERYANEIRTLGMEQEAGRTQDIASGFGNLFRSMIGS